MTNPQHDALRAALKPWAEAAAHVPADEPDFKIIAVVPAGPHAEAFKKLSRHLTAGHFRRAAEAYAALEKEMLDRPVGDGELDPLIERLTDNLGWAERYEIPFSQVSKDDLKRTLARLDISRPVVAEGWKTVPVEPTLEMFEAGESAFFTTYTGTATSSPDRVWEAMLAASPASPATPEGEKP